MRRPARPDRDRRRPRAALTAALAALGAAALAPGALAQQPTGAESDFFATAFTEYATSLDTASDGDLWPSCWSANGDLYAANGDGRGFSATAPWSDIVVNRVTGTPETGIAGVRLAAGDEVGTVWSDPEEYNRKPTGMVCVDGDGDGREELYVAVQDLRKPPPDNPFNDPEAFNDAPAASISRSDDGGLTWRKTAAPMFTGHEFTTIMFLDHGRSHENAVQDLGAEDGAYVYAYGLDGNWRDSYSDTVPDPTELFLARVPKDRIQDRAAWRFYAGSKGKRATWTADLAAREPVLTDTRRLYGTLRKPADFPDPRNVTVISQGSIVYNEPLDRYLYTSWSEYTFEFYEAPTPWGPWKLFSRKDFGGYPWFDAAPGCAGPKNGGYSVQIPSKFISADGKRMWLQSNWFVGNACGPGNYNFSLRTLDVEPYRRTKPSNPPDPQANLARAPGTTPIEKQAHYGKGAFYNDGILDQSEDSFDWENKPEDFWGYEWPREHTMDRVVYTTGWMFGNGGWFASDLRVQVRRDHRWVDVKRLETTPAYPYDPSAGPYKTYTLRFKRTSGDGVRIIGAPTPGPQGDGWFTSIAELAVFYDGRAAR